VESETYRRLASLAQQVNDLEGKVTRLETDRGSVSRYAGELEAAVAAKNAHIATLEAELRDRDDRLGQFQGSIFYRAYQRWRWIRGATNKHR